MDLVALLLKRMIKKIMVKFFQNQTREIVDSVLTELSGSNFALEIKEMVIEELKEEVGRMVEEQLNAIKEDLVQIAANRLVELLTDKLR
tara:strand:+ start:627 stop:893 length:267 start_codon:yes stop_codon:yes gene_type:complete